MTLERRITHLENNLKGKETRPDIKLDDVIRKLGLDPDTVRATAKENNQSGAEVIANELGMSYRDFVRALKIGAEEGRYIS